MKNNSILNDCYIDIKPVEDDIFDCFNGLIVSVAAYYKRTCWSIFASAWGFYYQHNGNENFGERLHSGKTDTANIFLKRYHGIEIDYRRFNEFNELDQLIQNQLSLRLPVVITLDSYWCPWHLAYQNAKYHLSHNILATGIRKDHCYRCIDPYFTNSVELLPMDHLKNGFRPVCATIKVLDEIERDIDWKEILDLSINNLKKNESKDDAFEALSDFIRDFADTFDLQKELDGHEKMVAVPLFRQLQDLIVCRKNFGKMLVYLAEQCAKPELRGLSEKMGCASRDWGAVRLLLLRYALKNDFNFPRDLLVKRLKEILNTEKEIMQTMQSLVVS